MTFASTIAVLIIGGLVSVLVGYFRKRGSKLAEHKNIYSYIAWAIFLITFGGLIIFVIFLNLLY